MGFKEVQYDSVVVSTTGILVPTEKIILSYANGTSRSTIVTVNDVIAVKFMEDNSLKTLSGKITNICNESYVILDASNLYENIVKKIYISKIRDITNVSKPDNDKSYDVYGNLIVETTDDNTSSESNQMSIILNKIDGLINSTNTINNDISTLKTTTTNINSDISMIRNDIGVMNNDINLIKSSEGEMSNKITSLENFSNTIQTSVTGLTERITALETKGGETV